MSARLVAVLLCCFATGCAPFSRPLASGTHSTSQTLSWLTQWVAAPLDTSPGFDPEVLKSPALRHEVAAEDLLEITIWDLYEPGRPHTYPVRVGSELTLEAPLLGEVAVAKHSLQDIERTLAAQYREREILLNPRLLVRSLSPPTLKIHVSGAVDQPGYVEVPREEPTIYAALLSAGGLKKNAGAQIGIQRRREPAPVVADATPSALATTGSATPPIHPIESHEPPPAAEPVSLANSLEVLSVSATAVVTTQTETSAAPRQDAQPSNESATSPLRPSASPNTPVDRPIVKNDFETRWYDLSRESDVMAVRELVLNQGDEVIVKSAAPPVRISGLVHRPGPYVPPAGKKMNVWQALQLAGGVRATDAPLNITLYRPASEGHGSQRWFLHVESIDERPATSPTVEPGDILHVEPTTASRIKRAVGDLWNKP